MKHEQTTETRLSAVHRHVQFKLALQRGGAEFTHALIQHGFDSGAHDNAN